MTSIPEMTRFESEYRRRIDRLRLGATRLETFMSFILTEDKVLHHGVSVRLKDVLSAKRKMLDKRYSQPWNQMTDLVGVRVLVYFREDTSIVEAVVRKFFAVDDENSSNKIEDLAFNEFGYTSRHLICSVPETCPNLELKSSLASIAFELQIRTVLEHAWAEVEHELVYKARTAVPTSIRRRFAASSAVIEVVEHEFARLRPFERDIINARVVRVKGDFAAVSGEILDRAWMMAVFTSVCPDGATWSHVPSEDVFFHGVELVLLSHLRYRGITTVSALTALLQSAALLRGLAAYAAQRGVEPEKLSHRALALGCCLTVGLDDDPWGVHEHMDSSLEEWFAAPPAGAATETRAVAEPSK